MGSVRKAAVTAGLGAAIVAGAAAPALAADHTVAPQSPTVPKVAEANSGTIGPFPVGQVTDTLGTGEVTGTLANAADASLPANLRSSTSEMPAVADLAKPVEAVGTAGQSTVPDVPDLGVPGMPGVTPALGAVTGSLPGIPGLPGVPGVTG